MICPDCGSKTRVVDCSKNIDDNEIYRKRVCPECGRVVFTVEFEVEPNWDFKETWTKGYRRTKTK